ncbi:MAG: HEPN domain-containing protein, partial [Chloroflexota bacterium]|nr:HEPN domain-containing protein [Chloroflexota bacterium]
ESVPRCSRYPFLYRHDLGYLLDLCRDADPSFVDLEPQIEGLTPYAVEMRYPVDLPLTPTREDVEVFYRQALATIKFVESKISRLLSDLQSSQ